MPTRNSFCNRKTVSSTRIWNEKGIVVVAAPKTMNRSYKFQRLRRKVVQPKPASFMQISRMHIVMNTRNNISIL